MSRLPEPPFLNRAGEGGLSENQKSFMAAVQEQSKRESYRQKYRAYVQSPHWKALRWDAIMKAGRICQSCAHNRRLEVHHINYRNLTDCTVADLVVLCTRCHGYFHEAMKVNGTKPSMYDKAETVTLIHNYCRQQNIPLNRPVATRPVRNMVQTAYKKCKNAGYSRKAIERLLIDVQAIFASIPEGNIVEPLTPFQQGVIHRARRGSSFIIFHHTPEQQEQLTELLNSGRLRLLGTTPRTLGIAN